VQILVIVLFLLLGNWILTDSLVYLPIWLLKHLSSWGLWTGAFGLLIFLGWCLGEDFNEL